MATDGAERTVRVELANRWLPFRKGGGILIIGPKTWRPWMSDLTTCRLGQLLVLTFGRSAREARLEAQNVP
jgi:hypothetical protein